MKNEMKYIVEFKRFEGNKKIGSTSFELSKENFDELKDIAREKF